MRILSNRQLARKTGASESHISRVRRGITPPSIDLALRMARTLGISINELMVRIKNGRMDY